ncbi:MAG TPA: glycosyltransferase [Cyclobacteriaceae bacterium]|nr:glycosyltransferase [Cyclobacteriaceae bacterium]
MATFHEIPIVIVSMSRWDGDFSSASWSLAKTFANNQTVIYVDYPYTWTEFVRTRKTPSVTKRKNALLGKENGLVQLKEFNRNLYALTPPLVFPINWLPKGKIFQKMSSLTDKILWRSIKKAIKQLGYSDLIFFNSFNPLYLSVPPQDSAIKAKVYQSRDNIRALEAYLQKHGPEAEKIAIQHADLSIVTSKQLQKDLTDLSGKQVEYLPNAADFELFKTAFTDKLEKPEDLQNIAHPIIGYTGNICHRVDYNLIQAICQAHPDKNLVMVGPRNHYGHTSIDLDAIPNLHFLGPKRLEQLPSYLAHFDVLILPFLINDVTKSIYPLKINEYLASGKPIVATPFSEDIKAFGHLISLEADHSLFSDGIERELKENSMEKSIRRNEEASKNTWEARVNSFWTLLQQALK